MQTQSVILSSFFWGYVVLQIPAGELAARYGGMVLITACIAINSAVSLLIPIGSHYGGWQLVCACRVVQGLLQGFLFPSMHNLIGKWVPLEEKSRLGTLIYAGAQFGTALQLMASGFVAEYWGWPAIFYMNGTLGAVWTVVYVFLGADSPQTSRMISAEERLYIQTSLGHVGGQKKLKTPWKKIWTSLSFISLIVVHCGQNWGFWTLMTEMPSYMSQVLGVDIKANGLMSALPYLAMYLCSFPLGFMSDYILKKKWLSITACRKLSNSIGLFGPAVALVGLSYVPAGKITLAVALLTIVVGLNAGHYTGFLLRVLCASGLFGPAVALVGLSYVPAGKITLAVALLTIVVGLNAGHYTGFLLVHIDMAPNFGGTLMGITNCLANVISIIAPLAAGAILKDETDPNEWRKVFYVSSAIYIVANVFFIIFGTSERQEWNEPLEDSKVDSNEENRQTMKCNISDDAENVAVFESEERMQKGWGYRHQQCLILFFCLTTCYSMRACMGVSLVAMTTSDTTHTTLYNHTNITSDNANKYKVDGVLSALLFSYPYPIFKWNKKTQDAILSSFFWGYVVLQVPAGQLAHRLGARRLLAGALFVNALVSFCLPWAAYYGGWAWVAVFRIKQGLSQACIMPGIHTLLGKWTPLRERSRLTAWVHGGHALGPVLGLPVTGFIASSPLGWPGVFRFYGVLAALVGALIWYLTADTPAKHPYITYGEKLYIENDIGDDSQKPKTVPWRKILSHRGMYAIIAAHIAQVWGQITLYGELPYFMDKVMGVNIKAKILSVTHTRKLATSVGSLSAAIGLIVLAFVPKKLVIVETVLVVLVGFKVATHAGVYVNNIDISPNFSGAMMSISNFISNLCASLAPIVTAFILTDVESIAQEVDISTSPNFPKTIHIDHTVHWYWAWRPFLGRLCTDILIAASEYLWRQVFFVAAGIYFISNLVYLILGTAERAEWNDLPKKQMTTNVEECNPMLDTEGKSTAADPKWCAFLYNPPNMGLQMYSDALTKYGSM
ncbi:Putative inorganic phosphate cotransporter [Papilio machaon]|uniref:Putative inorganic phosphate cotransporter n=1 Tax=Papilio machaon TaxID=76193 RepID=A0A194RGR8_PAPMA|nr:Putative inorganic phosphate cotransporter [Papilio machaon]